MNRIAFIVILIFLSSIKTESANKNKDKNKCWGLCGIVSKIMLL